MTAVTRYFFTPLYFPSGPWSVIRWWESRRLLYNVCVGTAGMVTLGTAWVFASLPPAFQVSSVPWIGVLVYGVLANLFYSLGPVADLGFRRILGDRGSAVGPVLFRYGFVFSIGLTLLPIPLAAMGWLARLLFF